MLSPTHRQKGIVPQKDNELWSILVEQQSNNIDPRSVSPFGRWLGQDLDRLV